MFRNWFQSGSNKSSNPSASHIANFKGENSWRELAFFVSTASNCNEAPGFLIKNAVGIFILCKISLECPALKLMSKNIFHHLQSFAAAFIVLSAVFAASTANLAAQSKTNERTQETAPARGTGQRREENKRPPDATRYFYEFTQKDFFIRHIVIEHDATGRGKITFERQGEETSIEEPINLSMGTLGRVLGAWTELGFLQSTEDYQADKQFPHLGTMRLTMERDKLKRTAEFNWTNNKNASLLVTEYRRVADQAVLVFDIGVARETQPLATPKLLDQFEMQMKRNDLADPLQLVSLLTDISTDEHLPLIARNHALRLIKKLQD